jgi:hypothetical protein
MARRELERRISHQEPDDHIKAPHEEHPELKLLTDAHEWHPYIGKEHRLDRDGIALEQVPRHMASEDDKEDGGVESEPPIKVSEGNDLALFVRIMSERVMMFARQTWVTERGLKKKKKKRRRSHMKEFKTLHRLRLRFLWPKMRSDISSWVRMCPHCILTDKQTRENKELVFSWPVTSPFFILHVDLWAPGSLTDYQNMIGNHIKHA